MFGEGCGLAAVEDVKNTLAQNINTLIFIPTKQSKLREKLINLYNANYQPL